MLTSRGAALVVAVIASALLGATLRHSTFVPWGTDAAAYIASAKRFAAGRLVEPSELQLGPGWGRDGSAVSALGHRPGIESGTDVVQYPLGYPLLIAAASAIGGEQAAFFVVPLCAALLVVATFSVGASTGDPWVGVLAAALVAASPVTFVTSVVPMSDVPSTSFWILAWALSLRAGVGAAAAAGAAAAMAVMIRPTLAPFGFVIALSLASSGGDADSRWHGRRLLMFVAFASLGPACVLWSQRVLYGGYLEPGYPTWQTFYAAAHIRPNLVNYPRFLSAIHTPVVYAGLLVPAVVLLNFRKTSRPLQRVVWAATALAILNLLLYLPFLVYDDIRFLRFMLPGITALFVLLALVQITTIRWCLQRSRPLALLAIVPVLVVVVTPLRMFSYGVSLAPTQTRVVLMGRYLREVLPANAVVIAHLQSNALAQYTGKPIVRWDFLTPEQLANAVTELQARRYRPVLVLDDFMELEGFRTRFAGSELGQLGWQPRAIARDQEAALIYFDLGDRLDVRAARARAVDVITAR